MSQYDGPLMDSTHWIHVHINNNNIIIIILLLIYIKNIYSISTILLVVKYNNFISVYYIFTAY